LENEYPVAEDEQVSPGETTVLDYRGENTDYEPSDIDRYELYSTCDDVIVTGDDRSPYCPDN